MPDYSTWRFSTPEQRKCAQKVNELKSEGFMIISLDIIYFMMNNEREFSMMVDEERERERERGLTVSG